MNMTSPYPAPPFRQHGRFAWVHLVKNLTFCRGLRLLLAGVCLSLLGACGGNDHADQEDYAPAFADQPLHPQLPTYVFAVHPLHNPERLFQVYEPLVDYLNRQLTGARIQLEASRSYDAYEKKLYSRHYDLALPNPYQTLRSLAHGYHVFGKMADDDNFHGIILVRKDSAVQSVEDLRGKAISFPAPTALAATMLPQWFLFQNGLNVSQDIENRYVGSQESSIMNVAMGLTAAGATWPPPWRAFTSTHPDIAAQLTVKWTTESLVNNGLVVRDDMDPAQLKRIATLLFALHNSDEGRAILAPMELSRFEPATDATYQPVADFIERFQQNVRPVEAPP